MTQKNNTSLYIRTLLKISLFLPFAVLGRALGVAGISLHYYEIFFLGFFCSPAVSYAVPKKSILHAFYALMYIVIVCTLFFIIAWNTRPIQNPVSQLPEHRATEEGGMRRLSPSVTK